MFLSMGYSSFNPYIGGWRYSFFKHLPPDFSLLYPRTAWFLPLDTIIFTPGLLNTAPWTSGFYPWTKVFTPWTSFYSFTLGQFWITPGQTISSSPNLHPGKVMKVLFFLSKYTPLVQHDCMPGHCKEPYGHVIWPPGHDIRPPGHIIKDRETPWTNHS